MKDEVYKDYVYNFKIDIGDNEICGQQKILDIDLFDNLLYVEPTDIYVPIIGVVHDTTNICFGVRCCEDTMYFKIYDKEAQKIYTVFLVGEIATIIKTYSAKSKITSTKLNHFKIVEKEEYLCQISTKVLKEILNSYNIEYPQNGLETRLAYEIANNEYSLPSYAMNLTGMAQAIYYNLVINFLVKNNVNDVSVLTDNKKTIKLFEKCKDKNGSIDVDQTTKLIAKIDITEWFDMSEKVKSLLPKYQVFEEFEESSFDLFKFGIPEDENCVNVTF